MKSYLHTNSSSMPPTMRNDPLAIYDAIAAGKPVTIERGHYTADDLCLVAERLRCDEVVAGLVAHGIDAKVVDFPTSREVGYVEAAVGIMGGSTGYVSVDAEAGRRVLQRLESGLSLDVALARTLEQCECPVLSEHAIRQMEREGDAVQRRLARTVSRSGDGGA